MNPVANDLGLYERHAAAWWDEGDPTFASLRAVQGFRMRMLEEWLEPDFATLRVVDLGCGGGLWAVPFAGAGALVIGVDQSGASLRAAGASTPATLRLLQGDVSSVPLVPGCANLVVLADVLEHVPDPAAVIREAARVLEPGGHLFLSTLNRTRRARILAVGVAERIGLIPRGTHDAKMFLRPAEVDGMATACGLQRQRLQGEALNLWLTLRHGRISLRRGRSRAVSYSALYRREPLR